MSRNDIPQFVAGLETLPFDRHGTLIIKLLKYLAGQAPRQTVQALVTAFKGKAR